MPTAPTSAAPPTAKQFFSRAGVLSQWHPNYEFRPGQLEMAVAVERALTEKRHLIVEAGTGTGKTLAYLVPAFLSGRRVVVSTGTKNLQEQLFYKDIPFLQQHFTQPLRVTLMKGRDNYLCRQKVYDADKEPVLSGLEEVSDFKIIRRWEKETATGDRSELRTLPERSTLWPKLNARRDTCTGQKCMQYERCFLTEMQRSAAESDILVVNHHLFFADLAVKRNDFGGILPDYGAVIFDEAHEIEDVAGMYFGTSVSNFQIFDLRKDLNATVRKKDRGSPELDRILIALDDATAQFFALFGDGEGRVGVPSTAALLELHEDKYRTLLLALELVATQIQLIHEAPEDFIPLHRRSVEIAQALVAWMEGRRSGHVYWLERRGRVVSLQATPIDVSSLLSDKVFDSIETVVLTSATLAVGGSFDYPKKRLGLATARSLHVDGQFDYEKQALLYVPPHLPDPSSAAFTPAASEEVLQILEHSRGRAFVLFTSYAQMKVVFERVTPHLKYPALLQGTRPRNALIEQFRATPNSVLFATSSFWQGVDVQGEQLSCVIIDKLPFAVPSDPIVEARRRAIEEAGGNAFFDYQVPEAALTLKQGFGRLIRSKTDRGVLALLDNRITKKSYGRIFFDSLPSYSFTTKMKDVEKFFAV